jgi:hypothetical protein
MRAEVFVSQTESGGVEISVVKEGLSFGAAHKYEGTGKAKTVLLAFGFEETLVDQQLKNLAETPPSKLLRFPAAEIGEDVLASLGFKAAAFRAA